MFHVQSSIMASGDIVPFNIDVPREEVDRLTEKLKDTRLPDRSIVPDAGDSYGNIWHLDMQRADMMANSL